MLRDGTVLSLLSYLLTYHHVDFVNVFLITAIVHRFSNISHILSQQTLEVASGIYFFADERALGSDLHKLMWLHSKQ